MWIPLIIDPSQTQSRTHANYPASNLENIFASYVSFFNVNNFWLWHDALFLSTARLIWLISGGRSNWTKLKSFEKEEASRELN